ncbi:cysteine desulfurase family protein [Saccharopolyspora sp. NFXS83]|uniref:cysteine desulfurase family protein n=1 Tax=Saccharopolyspora sp. NFXS83 TaxID=2993560 RepID=UPI00224B19ED|nr:cysteine desulfurase family protein [Saccharopolyspora sp. NFXS83]MCX2733961.1 cysteine desulfurase family protein [Saccharopolyspora sp. NFXS83]
MTYLDHAATTPMRAEAVTAMSEALARLGNASSLHTSGRRARRAVEESREGIATALGARPSEVLFTGGGTESDNLAVKGIFWARRGKEPARRRVLASAVEHHAVLDTVEWLAAHEGADVTWLPVDEHGRVRPEVLEDALRANPDDVALATVMWANNEVGTVNPIQELAAVADRYGVPLHTDAVQAVETVPVDFAASGAAALTMTGHKVGGPYGAGVLLLARHVECTPVLHGGGQEREVRSGTLDVPGVLGLASATREAVRRRAEHVPELAALRDELIDGVRAAVPDVILNGDPTLEVTGDSPARLPGNAHFTFPGCEGDSLLMLLDAQGIECSTGSACTAGVAEPSHVLLAMGAEPRAARSSLRFSLGHDSTGADVRALTEVIGPVVERARNAGLTGLRRAAAASTATTEV